MKLSSFEIDGRLRLGFGEIIDFVTRFWTLEPGDVMTTATPRPGRLSPGIS